jgi:hypothetical protein
MAPGSGCRSVAERVFCNCLRQKVARRVDQENRAERRQLKVSRHDSQTGGRDPSRPSVRCRHSILLTIGLGSSGHCLSGLLLRDQRSARPPHRRDLDDDLTVLGPNEVRQGFRLREESARWIGFQLALVPFVANAEVVGARQYDDSAPFVGMRVRPEPEAGRNFTRSTYTPGLVGSP